eukprot:730312-Karenia_brevis.AAC.1
MLDLGFTHDEVHELRSEVFENLWLLAEANSAAVIVATEMHRFTWCSFEGLPGVIRTKSGTIAGAPLADLTFNAAMRKILRSLRRRFEQHDLLLTVPCNANIQHLRPS